MEYGQLPEVSRAIRKRSGSLTRTDTPASISSLKRSSIDNVMDGLTISPRLFPFSLHLHAHLYVHNDFMRYLIKRKTPG